MAGFLPQMELMDVTGPLNAFRMGAQDSYQDSQRSLLRRVGQVASTDGLDAASKIALAGGDVSTGIKLSELSLDRQMKTYDFLGRAAVNADTPEKWTKYIDTLRQQFGNDSVKGFEDFKSRESAIILSKHASDMALAKQSSDNFNLSIGGMLGGQAAPAAPAVPSAQAGEPRGLRNNNPLNIEAGSFTQRLPGFQGSDGRFARFSSLEQGISAADVLLANYGKQGINTVSGVINKWAPPTENNSGAYAATVAKALGVSPGDPIDLADAATRQKLIGAMAQVENGRPLPTATPQAAPAAPAQSSPSVQGARIGGVPTQQMLPALLRAASDPNLPQGQKAVALEMLKSALDEAKLPNDVKEYLFAVGQGEKRTYTDWDVGRKQAASTKVTQNNKVEDAYDAERGKIRAKRESEIIESGDKAFASLGTINIMRRAMADPNFYTGVGAERFALPIRQAIVAFGGDPKGAASMEVFNAMSKRNVIDSMGGSLGAGFANADRDFVVGTVAGLQNTPEGNMLLLDVTEKVERRKIEVSKLAQAYIEEKGRLDIGFERVLTQFREKNPLFSPEERQKIQTMTASAQDISAELERRKK